MVIKANIKEAFSSLVGAKQRSVLALIGIIVGIGSVIAMVSVGSIVQKEALRQFLEMGTDILTISESYQESPSTKGKMTLDNALAIPEQCPEISLTAPYISSYETMKFLGEKKSIPALGVTPSFYDVNKLSLKQGRFIHELDQFMFYCVIGEKVESQLRGQGVRDMVGTRIIFKDKYFTIVGVINSVAMGGMRPYEINEGLMVHASTIKRLSKDNKIQNIIARTAGGAHYAAASDRIRQYYTSLNGLNVEVRSAEELIKQMQKQMRMFSLLLGSIGSISLIVGGIGVMNVMLVSVTERTKEIGIRRALGARQGDIQLQFLIESVMLCIVGGFMGIGIGVAASYIISYYASWEFSIAYDAIVLGVVVAVSVGIFFGIYPARQAARLSPILALRSD